MESRYALTQALAESKSDVLSGQSAVRAAAVSGAMSIRLHLTKKRIAWEVAIPTVDGLLRLTAAHVDEQQPLLVQTPKIYAKVPEE